MITTNFTGKYGVEHDFLWLWVMSVPPPIKPEISSPESLWGKSVFSKT
jgi:hypothetical protein